MIIGLRSVSYNINPLEATVVTTVNEPEFDLKGIYLNRTELK